MFIGLAILARILDFLLNSLMASLINKILLLIISIIACNLYFKKSIIMNDHIIIVINIAMLCRNHIIVQRVFRQRIAKSGMPNWGESENTPL